MSEKQRWTRMHCSWVAALRFVCYPASVMCQETFCCSHFLIFEDRRQCLQLAVQTAVF